jgi:hypothetical protein
MNIDLATIYLCLFIKMPRILRKVLDMTSFAESPY